VPRPDRIDDWREVLIVGAAEETGLVGAYERATEPVEAARALGLDPRAVRIVCGALQDYGYLEDAGDGRLALTARGRGLLGPAEDGSDPSADLALSARAIRAHLALPEVLRTGRRLDDVSRGDRATRERFLRAMRHVAATRVPVTVAEIGPPPPGGRLLDVGGGPGTYARALARAGWEVTVMDLPESIELAGEELARDGIAAVAGDATQAVPEGPWEAVYMGNFVHLFDRATASAIVARAGAAVAPGGLLAIQEVLRESPQGARFAVLMMLATDGGESYPESDYRAWMAAAGCPHERTVALEEGWHHLLIGRRAPA